MLEPTTLGRYQIHGVLGKGAMGIVYKAYDPVIERVVAIKTVRKDLGDSPLAEESVGRFKNEAKAAGRLVHPNIVGIYEYGEDESAAFIVMEYVEGTGLRDAMSLPAKLDLSQILSIMKQLLDALDFAHERGVIHRDVKPTNLILTSRGSLKVADFGIAHIDSSDLTVEGTVMGSPSYMSPEQIQGRTIDGRSDLFSAGVVLYELLVGERPFVGTLATIAYKTCHDEPVPPSLHSVLKLPPLVDAVVARALAKAPDARYQTGREFSAALQQALKPPSDQEGRESLTEAIPPAPSARNVTAPLEAAFVDKAASKLAVYLGPVASWVTRNAAKKAGSPEELLRILSDQLGAQERRAFLRDVGLTDV